MIQEIDNRKRKQKSMLYGGVTVIILVITFFVLLIFSYLQKFDQMLVQESKSHLSEIAQQIASYIETFIEKTKETVSTTADAMLHLPEKSRFSYLQEVGKTNEFAYIGFAEKDGLLWADAFPEPLNIVDQDYFQEAMAGKSSVTDIVLHIFKDRAVSGILFAVPISYQEGQAEGVLVAMLDIKKLQEALKVPMFGGEGYSYIVNQNGELILHSKSMEYSNWFTFLKNVRYAEGYDFKSVEENFKEQKEDLLLYNEFGVEKYAYYCPIGVNSWMVIDIVEKDVVTRNTASLTKEMAILSVGAVVIFLILLVSITVMFVLSEKRKQATEAKSAFLANVSHEIRTPMNAIVGISEILLREGLTAKQQEYVLSIINSGKGLLTIINDILDFSKIEAGKFSIVEEPYEIESILYDITSIVGVRIGDKPVNFFIDVEPDVPRELIGDMTRVKQILLNIVGNAAKFTEKGLIKLSLSCKIQEEDVLLQIIIMDTGIGIKTKDLERLFVSFNQVDTHHHHGKEGTGLGLAISRQLCRLMGGDIKVESEYGKGSVFTITIHQRKIEDTVLFYNEHWKENKILLFEKEQWLASFYQSCMEKMQIPFELVMQREEFDRRLEENKFSHVIADRFTIQQIVLLQKGQESCLVSLLGLREYSMMSIGCVNSSIYAPLFSFQLASILNGDPNVNYTPKRAGINLSAISMMPYVRILVVDDNEVNLQVASGLMAPYEMKMDCVLSGEEAIKAVRETHYDLIFMDHMMPEMDGVETVRAIRSLPEERFKTLPIVALTANATNDAKNMFLREGFDDFISKPIETLQLNVILRKWLKELNDKRQEESPELLYEQRQEKPNLFSTEVNDFLQEFQDSKEVDFESGCMKLGSLEVYVNVLRTYRKSTEQILIRLPELVREDFERCIVEIHGLKGASSAICVNLVAKLAKRLEEKGKKKDREGVEKEFPVFMKCCFRALKEIEVFLKTYEQEKKIDLIQQEKQSLTMEQLQEIKRAFLDFDTEWLKVFFETSKGNFSKETDERLFECLKKDYENYEFEHPVELIEEFIKN